MRRKKLFLGVQRIRNYKNVGARSRKNYFDSIIPIHNTNIIILQANGYEMRNYLSAHRQNRPIKEIPTSLNQSNLNSVPIPCGSVVEPVKKLRLRAVAV